MTQSPILKDNGTIHTAVPTSTAEPTMTTKVTEEEVGEISHPSIEVEWKIRDFFGLPQEMNHSLVSPIFNFLDSTWCLRLYPGGESIYESAGWISLYLEKKHSSYSKHRILFSLGINRIDDSKAQYRTVNYTFEGNNIDFGQNRYVSRKWLYRKRTEIMPDGVLTVVCGMSGEACEVVQASVQVEKPVETWHERISNMYRTKELADIRFVMKGRVFHAHRFVLASRSQKFARILRSPNVSIDEQLFVEENVTEAAFDTLLHFLYRDTLGTTDKTTIAEAYLCALTYQVPDLQITCQKEIDTWDITTEEVCTLLDIGLDVPNLRDKCVDLLRREGQAALASPEFLKISWRTVGFILESGALKNISGLERIERIMEWCVNPHPVDADYTSERKKLLGDGSVEKNLLGKLEFQALGLTELSHVVARYRGLLTPEELLSFLKYRKSQDTSILPEWCFLCP